MTPKQWLETVDSRSFRRRLFRWFDRFGREFAWRETADYTERERAALAWTEAVTRIADGHVPDDVYEVARQQFTDKELADLTLAVVTINGWNRLSIAFRTLPAKSREAGRNGHH